jgi:hypothetical protein
VTIRGWAYDATCTPPSSTHTMRVCDPIPQYRLLARFTRSELHAEHQVSNSFGTGRKTGSSYRSITVRDSQSILHSASVQEDLRRVATRCAHLSHRHILQHVLPPVLQIRNPFHANDFANRNVRYQADPLSPTDPTMPLFLCAAACQSGR